MGFKKVLHRTAKKKKKREANHNVTQMNRKIVGLMTFLYEKYMMTCISHLIFFSATS